MEFVGEDDVEETSDVEFIFEEKNHQFVISSSEDEVEEVISDDEQNVGEQSNHRKENGVPLGENNRVDEPEVQESEVHEPEVHGPEVQEPEEHETEAHEPEEHAREEHLDVNMENNSSEKQPGSSRSKTYNHHCLDADDEDEPETENVSLKNTFCTLRKENDVDADDECDEDLVVTSHYRSRPDNDLSVPSSSKPKNCNQSCRETIELSSSDEEEVNPFARTARRPESLSQKNNSGNLIPDRKSQKRPPSVSDEPILSKKPNISSSVDNSTNFNSRGTRYDCEVGHSEVSSFLPSSRVNNSKTPAARTSDSESNNDEEVDQPDLGAILISDSEEEETEPIRESNIQSSIIIL